MRFRSFDEFIRVWIKTTGSSPMAGLPPDRRRLRRRARRPGLLLRRAPVLTVGAGGPGRLLAGGVRGYCDGADEARERTAWSFASRRTSRAISRRRSASASPSGRCASATAAWPGSARRERTPLSPAPFARLRDRSRGGLKAAPHAGETAGPASIRSALDDLHADRLRHGVRAVEDPALLAELAERCIVCDVTR